MTYTCTWATKRAKGTIDLEAHNVAEVKKRARSVLRDGYGLRVKIVDVEKWAPGKERRKAK